MALDGLSSALSMITGASEATRSRAMDAAGGLFAVPGIGPATAKAAQVTAQLSTLAEGVVAAAAANRSMVTDTVRAEVDVQLQRVGLTTSGGLTSAQEEIDRLKAQVSDLRRALANRSPVGSTDPGDARSMRPSQSTLARRATSEAPAGRVSSGTAGRPSTAAARSAARTASRKATPSAAQPQRATTGSDGPSVAAAATSTTTRKAASAEKAAPTRKSPKRTSGAAKRASATERVAKKSVAEKSAAKKSAVAKSSGPKAAKSSARGKAPTADSATKRSVAKRTTVTSLGGAATPTPGSSEPTPTGAVVEQGNTRHLDAQPSAPVSTPDAIADVAMSEATNAVVEQGNTRHLDGGGSQDAHRSTAGTDASTDKSTSTAPTTSPGSGSADES